MSQGASANSANACNLTRCGGITERLMQPRARNCASCRIAFGRKHPRWSQIETMIRHRLEGNTGHGQNFSIAIIGHASRPMRLFADDDPPRARSRAMSDERLPRSGRSHAIDRARLDAPANKVTTEMLSWCIKQAAKAAPHLHQAQLREGKMERLLVVK